MVYIMEINQKLIEFLEEFNPSKKPVTKNTRLYHDMNVYGDEADELITAYSKKFNVDISAFRFSDYFPVEGDSFLYNLIRGILRKPKKELKEFPIKNLQEGIENKVLK